MYDINDPVVKYYDFTLAQCPQEEIDYYVNEAMSQGDKAIDLCCGTGILTMALCKKIKMVYAIDYSKAMLDKLKIKLLENKNIRIIHSNMDSFSISEKVDTVICRDAFFHALNQDMQKKTLISVYNSLKDGGLFTFNIYFPNPNYLVYTQSADAKKYTSKGKYSISENNEEVEVFQSLESDYVTQLITTKLKFVSIKNGGIINEEYSEWKARYTNLYELEYLLEMNGFRIEEKYGWYDKKVWDLDNMLIVKARKIPLTTA